MEIIESTEEMQAVCLSLRRSGRAIGLVPTMGAFHEGHLSLIRESRRRDEVTVVSLFVNPIQFGPSEDYQCYPRDLGEDKSKASSLGVHYLFLPSPEAMYPPGCSSYVTVEGLSDKLCGASRPGHFRGVCTVVAKLFHLTLPTRAYFGQKDAQQAAIVARMILDLNWGIELVVLPTVREGDGLAMSSRNSYLQQEERRQAAVLFRSLQWAEEEIRTGERDARRIEEGMKAMICAMPAAQIEYVSVVDPLSLEGVETIQGRVLIALAVQFGQARLIDDALVTV